MKAAIVSRLSDDEIARLCSEYPSIEWISVHDNRDALAGLGPDVGIVYGNVRPHEFEKLSGLKWIHATWTGVENLMRLPLQEHGVVVTNTHGHVSRAITEHVVGSVYYLARSFGRFHDASMNGEWCRSADVAYVQGSHALVLGLGALGRPVCAALKANGMRVSGVNSSGMAVTDCDAVYTPRTCRSVLGEVDHVVCCLPATPQTDNSINADFFKACKDGVTLINVGRGNAVNQDDLLAAIESGRVKGAVLDTTTPEPLPADSPLFRNPRILVTAHQSWRPSDFGTVAFDTFLRNLPAFLDGTVDIMPDRVDPEKGY